MTTTTIAPGSVAQIRDLYADLHRFGTELRDAALQFQDMVRGGSFAEHGDEFRYASDDPRHLLNRSIDITRRFEFLVAVTGAFSSGKSTLLNLLLDVPDLLPASVIPMTAVCTVIRYGDRPRARVRYAPWHEAFARVQENIPERFARPFTGPEHLQDAIDSPESFVSGTEHRESVRRFATTLQRYDEFAGGRHGGTVDVAFDERAPLIAGGGVIADPAGGVRYYRPTPAEERAYLAAGGDPRRWVTREWLALIRDVTLEVPSPLLENDVVFLDLPGLNCREDYHRRAIREYCNRADCILVTAFQPGNQADADVIASFKQLSSNHHEKTFFVFNKVDQFAQEPGELARAIDYLTRDTIGADFPDERFFLTSAQLARTRRNGDESWRHDVERLRRALGSVGDPVGGMSDLVARLTDDDDPGGVGHVRDSLWRFLVDEAYPTKVAEVVRNLATVASSLRDAASPALIETRHVDSSEVLRKTVLEYFRHVRKLQETALRRFRYEYLRGDDGRDGATLRADLSVILEQLHRRIVEVVRDYFDRPILSAPLLEDPVSDFDLLTVADEASRTLRDELQELVIDAVHRRVNERFAAHLEEVGTHDHLRNVFRGAPDFARRAESILQDFERTMRHSERTIVRTGFHHLPRGRQLKRLAHSVPLARMKETLVEIFSDFYPAWIYENVFNEVIDRLWLSLFLDTEDLERELAAFFGSSESVVTGVRVAEQAIVPPEVVQGQRGAWRAVRMCQRIRELGDRQTELEQRAAGLGGAA